jgi:hypothetical protein
VDRGRNRGKDTNHALFSLALTVNVLCHHIDCEGLRLIDYTILDARHKGLEDVQRMRISAYRQQKDTSDERDHTTTNYVYYYGNHQHALLRGLLTGNRLLLAHG